jgi:hypothetical protein
MITILSMLETGYESSFEHLAFRQLKGAFQCNLVTVPHNFPTMAEALAATQGTKVFMFPPNRVASTEFADFVLPDGDVVFVFGSPQEPLKDYVEDGDTCLQITTVGASDMMAVCVAAQVLYVHG